MTKLFAILALGLCACGGGTVVQAPSPVVPAHVEPHVAVQLELTENNSQPVEVELAHGGHAQAIHCTSELDCMQRLAGLCANGYNGGQTLSDGQHTVGVLFRCITDEEKAQAAREEAEEKAQRAEFMAARAARLQAEKDAAAAAQKKTTTTNKK